MNRHFTFSKALMAVLLFIGIALGQSAFAQTTWSLQPTSSGNTITYKVKRSGDISQAVTVRYRTVGLSSYEGENFTSANGTLTFPAGIDQQTVTVTTQTPSTEAYKYYQSGAARKYLFEVTDMGGFTLLSREDNAGAGTVFNTSYLNQSVTDLVYFNSNGAIKSGDGNKYVDASYSSSSWVQVTESGYSQAVHTISTNNLYSNNSSATSFRSYLNEIGYNMYATVYFTQMEEQDGYQYIQILADNSSTYDGDDPDGAVNAPSTSLYKACFILSYDPSGSVMSDAHYQFFPHRYDYVDMAAEQTAGISHYEFDYDNSHLYQQKFRRTSYQASTSGSLVLAPTVNNLNVRFDAAGSGGDTWDFKNLKVRLALVDATKPTIRNNNDIRVADGAYGYGNTMYITIPFTEIVTVTGTPTLSTTWGTLNYIAGSGTNVLTFSGNIQADLGTVLTVNSIGGTSFTIKDLMGNTCNNTSINKTFNGLQVTNPWTGSGTANDPYIIMDRYQLDLLSKLVWAGNYYENKYFKLGANITYSSSTSWSSTSSFTSNFTSIGGWGHSFRGVFDGDGHSISGIRIYTSGTTDNDQCQGLFGYASSATVKNLVLYDANIVGYKQVGAIAGSQTYGTFQDCYIYNTRVAATSGTQQEVIAGSISGGTRDRIYFKNCKIGSNAGQHNIVKLTLTNNATVTRTPVTTVNTTLTTYSDGATISGEEYYSPDAAITLGYSSSVSSGSFVKYTASTSTGDITFTNIDGNVLTMPDADVTVSAAILPVVTYLDADGNPQQCSDYTLITSSTSGVEMGASGKTHWYVVSSDATINAMLKFTDATANIILCNGATLNINRTDSGMAVVAQGLNIFGQTNGNGTLNVTASNGSGLSSHDLGIYGGIVSASGGIKGINSGSNSITLGYTAAANRVTASSYLCNSLTVKAGQTLTDGEGHLYSGTYSGDDLTTALNAMATKTLQPAYSITLPNNFTVTGTTAAKGFAPANEVVTLHTAEGYTITSASYTPAGGSATTINPVEGVWSFTMPTANTTVSATRIINTYTVHFDANATNGIDVTGTMEDMNFTYGQAQNLTTNDFERTGYTFDGWNTAADGSGDAYTDQQNVNNLTNVLNGVVTLYAQWSIIPWEGNGTSENDPYIIIYASQLVKLSEDVNGGNGYSNKFFKLGNDINMSGVAFDGIGSSSARSFGGTFNGDGKTVSNVIVNKSEQKYVGFFGYVYYGTVRNLILDGVSISGYQYVGVLVGKGDSCSIENCLVMNSSVTYTNRNYIGVICGSPNEVSLTGNHYRNCTCNNTQTTNIGVGAFTNSNDVDGARSIHTLALPEHVTASSVDMLTYDNVTYYASNVEVTLTPAQGITLADVTVNGVAATHQQEETWTFTMPAADATVTCTSSVPYIDADGNQQTCSNYTIIESSESDVSLGTNGQDCWFVVSGNVNINGKLFLSGGHLILCDGATLNINHTNNNDGLWSNNLIIYGQSVGNGTLTASAPWNGIHSNNGLTINGGIISATSTTSTAINAGNGNLTINRGSVTAHGHYHGMWGENIIINGGIVNATNGEGSDSYGIIAFQDITLGYTELTDRITASSYKSDDGTISVKAGQALYDGTAVAYSGTLNSTQIDAIAGKTLEPCFILTLPELVNATGVIRQDGTTAYALAGAEITLAAVEGYEITDGTTSFTMPAQDVVSDVTVQIITYNITYDLAGGSVSTANPTTYNIETATFTLNNPTREHYTFAGWTGTDLDEPTMNVTITQGSIGDRSYTATWTPIFYNITYDLAGGTVATANPNTYNIETETFTLNNPTREGYTFVGWTGTDLTEPTQTVTIAQGSIGDRTYTATWDRLERYYTFDSTTGELALIWGEYNKDNKWGSDVNASAVTSVTATDEVSFTGDCTNLFFGFTNCTSMDLNNVNTEGVTNMACMFEDCSSLITLDLSDWNTGAVTRMDNLFFECTKLKTLNLTGWDVSHVTRMTVLFFNCQSLTTIEGIKQWNPSRVIGMHSMFEYCKSLKSLDLSGWNTESLTDMGVMFMGCDSIQTLNLSGWDVSNVTDMNSLFWGCKSLETLDVSGWNTSSVTNMGLMFYDCSSLTTLHRSEWNTENVTNMGSMFYRCSSLTTLDLSDWNTESVTDMYSMFTYCSNLATIYAGEGWSVESAASAGGGMFYDCTSLVGGMGTTYNPQHINGDYARYDQGSEEPGYLTGVFTLALPDDVTATATPTLVHGEVNLYAGGTDITLNYGGEVPEGYVPVFSVNDIAFEGNTFAMPFEDATVTVDVQQLRYIFNSTTGELALIWGEFNKDNKWGNDVPIAEVTSVTATDEVSFTGDCSSLFWDFTNCTSMDLSQVNTDECTNMGSMFLGCTSLESLDISSWNTGNVTNMSSMFTGCTSLESLDISSWNTGNVTNMSGMFHSCSSFTTLDLSGFNTGNVTNIFYMFMSCTNLTTLNLSGWDVSSVTNMAHMFNGCSSLTTLDVSDWTIGNANMGFAFYACTGLTTLDLSTWNTEEVTDMQLTFSSCSNLITIYVGDGWSTENVTSSVAMFDGSTSLVGGNGTTYDENHIDGEYARIDRPGEPGYLSAIPLDPVEYIDADGQTAYCQYYTILNGSTDYIDYGEGDVEAWYVVDHNVTYSDGLYFDGPTNLILVDGATLTINDETEDNGYMSCNDRLTIYVQSEGTGAITAVNSDIEAYGDLIIHGGHIALSSDNDQAYMYSSSDMTINGGAISIENGNYHCIYASGQLTINEGTLNAVVTEGYDGYDVIYSEEDVVINGGNITVTNQGYGRGIVGDNVTINGGCVKVYIVEDYGYSGIGIDWLDGEVITLGWTDPSDLIMSQGGYDTYQLSIAAGQAFTDGEGNYYAGTLNWDEIEALAGKTLRPFTNLDETFHITYVINGGTMPSGYPETYTFDETVTLPVPTKADNTFVGWYKDSYCNDSPVTEIAAGTTLGDLTLYASWKPEKTWVDYLDADGQPQRAYATILYGGDEAEYPAGVYTLEEIILGKSYGGGSYNRLNFTGDAILILPDYSDLNIGAPIHKDDEDGLSVSGDLTIYGQTGGFGSCNATRIQATGKVDIYGGDLYIDNLSASNITLGWTGLENTYSFNQVAGNVTMAKDFRLQNDQGTSVVHAGSITSSVLEQVSLYPYATTIDISYMDENGDTQTVNATVLWGDETNLPGGFYTIMEYELYIDHDLSFNDNTTLIVPRGYLAIGGNLTVGGNLSMYGYGYFDMNNDSYGIQATGDVLFCVSNAHMYYSNLTAGGNVFIAQGSFDANKIVGNTITLGYLSTSDHIRCGAFNEEGGYVGNVVVREGQALQQGGNVYSGTLTTEQISAIKGKGLIPYIPTTSTLAVTGYGESTESDHWVFIASPIVGFIDPYSVTNLIDGMSPSGQSNFDLYRFNQSAELEWENFYQHLTGVNSFMLENGKGYLYANKNDVTLEFNGAVYPAASKEVALDYDANAEFAGWNLVGNPFNAPATLDKSYYQMNSTGTGLVAEAVSGNTTIEAFTGVMVKADGEDETVLFTKSNAKGQQETGFGILQIALTQPGNRGNALLDNAIVSFNEGDELGKFYFGSQDANIYIPVGHEEYAIAFSDAQGEMPLNFKAQKNGEYTLTVSAPLNSKFLILNYLHLVDHLTGADIDLLQTPSYSFNARTSDYVSRFKLVFNANGTEDNDDFAFIDADGNIVINGTGTLQIIDMLGHVLATRDVHSDSCLLSSDFLSSGVYVLRLMNGDQVKTQKIVIK